MAFKENDAFEHTLFGFCDIGQKIIAVIAIY